MIKKFFTVMLGSLAAIWVSVFLAMLLGLLLVGSAVGSMFGASDITTSVSDNSVLHVDLSGVIVERSQGGSLMSELAKTESSNGSLCEYVTAIRRSVRDKKIKGLFIDCGGSSLGTASRQELVEAISDFSNSGKWVIAYGDAYTQGDYFVACAASEMYVNPVGMVDIHGIASSTPFFKGLLDKIGVKMQVVKVGKFKSAVEPFILTEASEPSKMQTRTYIDGIWDEVSTYIAERRDTSADTVTMWAADMAATFPVETLMEKGIVSHKAYRSEVEKIMKGRCGIKDDEDLKLITPSSYLAYSESENEEKKDHVAVLYAVGDIVDSGSEGIVGARMVPEILDLANDEHVKGLVLRVNSGGGSAFASEQIWKALEDFKAKGKKFYVSMGDVAASGGYYISCGAEKIYADPATLTGSIGIFGLIPCFEGLVTDKLGVTFSTVETNENADFISVMKPFTTTQHEAMQRMIENGYETFVGRVAEGRDMSVDSVKTIAEGRVWYGRDALRIGLVDTLASLNTAVRDLTAELGLSADRYMNYPEVNEPKFLALVRSLTGDMDMSAYIYSALGIDAGKCTPEIRNTIDRLARILGQVAGQAPVQARMEDITIM